MQQLFIVAPLLFLKLQLDLAALLLGWTESEKKKYLTYGVVKVDSLDSRLNFICSSTQLREIRTALLCIPGKHKQGLPPSH